MSEIALRVNLSQLATSSPIINGAVLARLSEAVKHVSAKTATVWQTSVHKAKLWSGERSRYADSIGWRMTGTLSAEVYATYNQAQGIETGRPGRDLKAMLHTSMKVRTTKGGKRYLIIPFRHNTPGNNAHAHDMPQHVYDAAKKLKASKVTGMGSRASGTGAMDVKTRKPVHVAQATYLWGGRLPAGSMGPNPKGKVDRYAGMVRMEETSGKAKKSTFLTFRIMMEGSSGWVTKPQPGLYIAKEVTDQMRPDAIEEFKNAVAGVTL